MNVVHVPKNRNVINEEDEVELTDRLDWIFPVLFNVTFIFFSLWIFISLIDYGVKTRKWKRNCKMPVDKLNAGIVYSFVVVCSVSCLLFLVSDLIFMSVKDTRLCEAAADATTLLYAMVLWSVFLFLWFRQKAFYTNNAFTSKVNKCVKFFSFASIVMISTSGLVYVLLFTVPNNYVGSTEGCIYDFANKSLPESYGTCIVCFILFSHVILLCLFIYPLLESRKYERKCFGKCCKRQKPKPNTDQPLPEKVKIFRIFGRPMEQARPYSRRSLSLKPSRKHIRLLLRKTFLFALLSTLTDVSNQIICFYFTTTHRRFHSLMFDFAAFFNLLFLLLSFSTYKNILKSLLTKRSAAQRHLV